MDAGSYHRAVAVYSRALEYDPSLAYVYAGRAGAYSRTGQLDRAVADLTQAIERTTLRGRLYYRRGVLYRMQGDSRSALEDFGRAIEASPSLEEARILRYSIRVEFPNLCPDARLASEELEERSLPADEDYWNPLVKYLRTGEGLNDAQAAAERAGTQKLVVMALAEESRMHHNTLIAQEWYRQCLTQAEPDDALHIYCQWGLEQCR